MTTYYVGTGGNDSNDGTTWALRKLTLNGAEDIPVAAGDTVYVGPGTYRELLTVDVSGTAGNLITYIGDYSGANTDGVGGVVRITGSDNDQSATRANCISASGKSYRYFQGFLCDVTTGPTINLASGCTYITLKGCFLGPTVQWDHTVYLTGTSSNIAIDSCIFTPCTGGSGVFLTHTSTVDSSAITIDNCLFHSGYIGINSVRVGGVTVRNCTFFSRIGTGIKIETALSAGQTITVNNCLFYGPAVALSATTSGEIVENYNSFYGVQTARTNTDTGANSNTYPPLFDTRWFFEMVSGNGKMLSHFDMASYSQLVNVAGTSPTSTDLRGTGTLGTQREWGALEYDDSLLYRRVIARQV